jgi:predicted nucleotidyltransferase
MIKRVICKLEVLGMEMEHGSCIQNIRKEILAIAKTHGALSVRLFGSYARGEEQLPSDIDLLVEMEPGRSLLDIIAIKQEVEDLVGKKVDVVTEAALSPYLRDEVLREAVAL